MTSDDLHTLAQLNREHTRRLSVDRSHIHTQALTPSDFGASVHHLNQGILEYCINALGDTVNAPDSANRADFKQLLDHLLSSLALRQIQGIQPSPATEERQKDHELLTRKALLGFVGSDGLCFACSTIFIGNISGGRTEIKEGPFIPVAFCYLMANSGCRLCEVLLNGVDDRTTQAILRHSVSYPSGGMMRPRYGIQTWSRDNLQSLRLFVEFEERDLRDVRDMETTAEIFNIFSEIERSYYSRQIAQSTENRSYAGNVRNPALSSQHLLKRLGFLNIVDRVFEDDVEAMLKPRAILDLTALAADDPILEWNESHYDDSTGSEKSLRMIHGWFSDCDTNHPCCGQTGTFLPTRLLKICKALQNGQQSIIQLVDTAKLHLSPAYITLSYCWGKTKTYKLTTATELALRNGIESSCLPQTFQDSIRFAIHFDMEYLWIDSLCIFQDSLLDWRQQSLSMSDIYSHSWCTVSATASADSNSGLFRQREVQSLKPLVVKSSWESQSTTSYYGTMDHMEEIINSPISLRGWTLQERLLSRRIVHFARTQLYWSCRDYHTAESFLGGIPDFHIKGSETQQQWYYYLKAPSEEGQLVSEASLLDLWCRVIGHYCAASLSEGKDKLVAISGLANQFQVCLASRNIKPTYFAGLWEFQIIHCMLWATDGNVSKRPKKYRAPSWTWAAIDTPISFRYPREGKGHTRETIAVVQEAWTETANDPLGQVSNGWLRIDCFLKEVTLQDITQNFPPSTIFTDPVFSGVKLDGQIIWDDECSIADLRERTYFLMPLQKAVNQYPDIHGLLLEHISGDDGMQYRRVAYYWIRHIPERVFWEKKDVQRDKPIEPEDLLEANQKYGGHFSLLGYDRKIVTVV